jgi:hypothetical protein
MHHIMSNDPCRRFVLGLTIENTSTRIWYTNRSNVFVTQSFNFQSVRPTSLPKSDKRIPLIQNFQEPATLISIFASLSFATDDALGWDPSIKRVLVDGKMCYEIEVHGVEGAKSVYRTHKVISDVGAIGLRGRGTRVFLARWLDQNGQAVGDLVALKDAWVDVTRPGKEKIVRS